MKYEPRETQSGWLIVQRSEPSDGVVGLASMMKMTQYLRNKEGKLRRFPTEKAANDHITLLQEAKQAGVSHA